MNLTMVISLCLCSRTQIGISEAVVLQIPINDMFSKLVMPVGHLGGSQV